VKPAAGVLAAVTEAALRDEVDRVGAAVGMPVIHASAGLTGGPDLSRKTWTAAVAVLLDESAAGHCRRGLLPRRAHVVVVTSAAPTTPTFEAAIRVGAQRIVTLPAEGHTLVRELAEAADSARDDARRGQLVTVAGGCGGAGASLFAAALAQTAGEALLVDLDPCGGGLDLLMGTENTAGLRWPDLAVQGGRLMWPAVREALPRHRDVSVLSGVRRGYRPDPATVDAVLDAGRRGGATVICDAPRCPAEAGETAVAGADLVVVVSPCDVRACAATTSIAPLLSALNPNVGLVVRGPAPGGLRAAEFAEIAGLPLLASMRAEPRIAQRLEVGGLRVRRRSALAAAARRVMGVLATPSAPVHKVVAA
jgi:secretion/DNA translocation related CpaE-like protein